MLISLTVGKVDAGVAVLLTEDKRHIEFPSILLPPSISSGSIVDITVKQNYTAEQKAQHDFQSLQERILSTYGLTAPTTPELRLRNATQTSLVLEWDPIQLATSTLRSLSLYRNGSKAGNIPRPLEMHSTKISGLAVDTEYSFYLVLRTSGGTYTSNVLTVKTHKMTDLTGITVTPGVLPQQLRESLEVATQRIGCKFVETVRIDTTHFVCTEGRGKDWEKAVEMNIPVVRPEWLEGCEREGKIVGVRGYYLDANPKHRQVGSNPALAEQSRSSSTQHIPIRESTASPTAAAAAAAARSDASLPGSGRASAVKSPGVPSAGSSSNDGEPGPDAPPTPPPKRETDITSPPPPTVPPKYESAEEDSDDEETAAESSRPADPPATTATTTTIQDKEIEAETSPRQDSDEDSDESDNGEEEIEKSNRLAKTDTGEEMEDVAL